MTPFLLWAALALGQLGTREHITTEPVFQGVTAHAPVAPEHHQHNIGGSDGAGICVVCSLVACLRHQGYPEEADKLLAVAHDRTGGHDPGKLERLLREVIPHVPFLQYVGDDPAFLDEWNAAGYPLGVTYGYSDRPEYRGQLIPHMVTGIHLDPELGAITDNNFTGDYSWMTRDEFLRRWVAVGGGWAVVFTESRRPPDAPATETDTYYWAVAGAAGLLLILLPRRGA